MRVLTRLIGSGWGARAEPKVPSLWRARERTSGGDVDRVSLYAPAPRVGGTASALGLTVAARAEALGCIVGRVEIAVGEPPILVALAPRIDLVALAVERVLLTGSAHRRPSVWYALAPGTFLGRVVDPDRPFEGAPAAIQASLGFAGVIGAARIDPIAGRSGMWFEVRIFGSAAFRRSAFRTGREELSRVAGWVRSQAAIPDPGGKTVRR